MNKWNGIYKRIDEHYDIVDLHLAGSCYDLSHALQGRISEILYVGFQGNIEFSISDMIMKAQERKVE